MCLLPAVKNSFPPCNPVRLHFLYLSSRRIPVIGVWVTGGGRFCVGCRLSLSYRRKFRSGPCVCRKFNLVPHVFILVLLLISVIESLIIFNCALPLKLII